MSNHKENNNETDNLNSEIIKTNNNNESSCRITLKYDPMKGALFYFNDYIMKEKNISNYIIISSTNLEVGDVLYHYDIIEVKNATIYFIEKNEKTANGKLVIFCKKMCENITTDETVVIFISDYTYNKIIKANTTFTNYNLKELVNSISKKIKQKNYE